MLQKDDLLKHNRSICFIAGQLGLGGAERQLFYILKTLQDLNWEIFLISLTKGEYWEKQIKELGIPVYYAGKSENRLKRLFVIFSYIYHHRPAIIQSQHFHTNIYAAFSGRILKIPSIGAIRSTVVDEILNAGKGFGEICLRGPKYLAANSYTGLLNAIKKGISEQRIRYLPNVIDTTRFYPTNKTQNGQVITILLVSNLSLPQKRVELFIEAIAKLKRRNATPIKAKIVGDGILKTQLLNVAERLEVYPDTFEFLGKRTNIEEIYRNSDIFILTSEREGTPNVIMEAMASGLPIVATDVGGVKDLVNDRVTGFLVQSGDVESLVEKMIILIEDGKLREKMGLLAREYIVSNHSLRNFSHVLTEFFNSIV